MKKVFIVTTMLLCSLTARAAEVDTRPWFVIAGGAAMLDESEGVSNDTRTGFMLGAGWDFSDMLAAEFALNHLGTYRLEGGGGDFDARSLSASLQPYMQLDRLRLFGRAGLGLWSAKVTAGSDEIGVDPLLGVGIDVRLGRAITEWSLRAEATRHFNVDETDIDTIFIGFSFRH